MNMDRREGADHEQLLQAHTHVWKHIFSFINTTTLGCAVELRIPEAIHKHGGQPVPFSKLVAELEIPPSKASLLRRLMRLLSHSGFFTRLRNDDGEEAYLLTTLSEHLLPDNPRSLHPLSLLTLDPMLLTPFQSLGAWLRGGSSPTPFHHLHGESFFEMAGRRPKMSGLFNETMASESRILMDVVMIREHGEVFRGLKSLVDVGGGSGVAAAAVAEAFPPLKCTVLDLPHVVASAPRNTAVDFVAGNMFEYIPPADAVLLKWVLHCFNDEQCVKLLKLCREAVPHKEQGGKVIVVDIVMREGDCDRESREAQHFHDMVMMVIHGGIERSEEEWSKLCGDSGFSGYNITSGSGLRDIIELYP